MIFRIFLSGKCSENERQRVTKRRAQNGILISSSLIRFSAHFFLKSRRLWKILDGYNWILIFLVSQSTSLSGEERTPIFFHSSFCFWTNWVVAWETVLRIKHRSKLVFLICLFRLSFVENGKHKEHSSTVWRKQKRRKQP